MKPMTERMIDLYQTFQSLSDFIYSERPTYFEPNEGAHKGRILFKKRRY